MANNRMYLICNVCYPPNSEWDDFKTWKNVAFHLAKWYPGEVGEWYTNRDDTIGKALDEFFTAHAHPNKYPGGVENPVRLEYEWNGTPEHKVRSKKCVT